MLFNGIHNQAKIYATWKPMIEAMNDIEDDTLKMSTALVLENTQNMIDQQYQIQNSRGLITEQAGITTAGAMGPFGTAGSIAGTATILAGLGLYFLVRPKDAIPHNNVKNNVNR